MKITFLGATQTVTGSKYLVECGDKKILIDCGLFQGYKDLRLKNWEKLPIKPADIDFVILTHAHIDHSGYIPLLVKDGFKGKIYCSEGTMDLCEILLPDSGFLQEEDAFRANKYGYSRHKPALPLYTEKEARHSLKLFRAVKHKKHIHIDDDTFFHLRNSGHILGSSFVILSHKGKVVTFSGDLGRHRDPILRPPAKITHTDYLVIESTYGDRLHERKGPAKKIRDIILHTISKGGSVIIPAFAVGRTQTILYYIYKLKKLGEIPDLPVFLDSPMAINATNILLKHKSEQKLSEELCYDVCNIATYVRTAEESKHIDGLYVPRIIISASGMATGGRILHHLKHFITDHKNTILFTGFQAPGTRGDLLVEGKKEIKIHGQTFPVKARVENLTSVSAHADYEEILDWLKNFKKAPKKVFITHGEIDAANALKQKIEHEFGWDVIVPEYLQEENL